MRKIALYALVPLFALAASSAWAQAASPAGLWQNIDDETGKPKALIRIADNKGVLSGKIEKLYRKPDEDQNPVCDKCEGARKDQPIVGVTILNGLKREGEGREYGGGEILDPANGKLYKSKLTLSEDGKKLDVRGYIGVPLLGRTQTWVRVE